MLKSDFFSLSALGEFPKEATETLFKEYTALLHCPAALFLLEDRRTRFEEGSRFSYNDSCKELQESAKAVGVHPFTSDFLFYFHLASALHEQYKKHALPEQWFRGVLLDLRCKLMECREVYGIWGSFVAVWFSRFWNFSLYAIGRLEFCLIPSAFDYEKDGLSIKKGQLCIDVHIPSRGRLVRRELAQSYKEAAAFFAPKLEAPTAFQCESWLLFEHHKEMLPSDCGIRQFAEDYTYMEKAPDEGDLWRIFGDADTSKPEFLPEKTSLQRTYKRWLSEGKPVYCGKGIFFFDQFKE